MPEAPLSPLIEAAAAPGRSATPAGAAAGFSGNWQTLPGGEFIAVWLQRLCTALPGTRSGLVLEPASGAFRPAASWPATQPPPQALIRIAERAANADRPVIAWARRPDETGILDLLIGVAVRGNQSSLAVIGIAIGVRGGTESVNPDALAEQVLLGSGWLEARLLLQLADTATARLERVSAAMDVVALASLHRRPDRIATAVVNELAVRLRCDRVSLGIVRRKGIRLRAMSQVASFQRRGRVVDAIENAMEECLAQAAPVAYPAPSPAATRVSVAHRDLAALTPGSSACLSVVLPASGANVGVLTLERHDGAPFDAATLLLAEAIGALLGPVLHMQIAQDRLLSGRAVDTLRDAGTTLLGPERHSLKLFAVAGLAVAAVLLLGSGEYRVTSRAVLEGEVQRAEVAPFDGFIAASSVRPGDHLHAGQVLAAMDDRDLVLERTRAWADAEKLKEKYNEAMAKHDRSAASILTAQIAQAQAQLALAEDKLKRARIVAPIDGVLIDGDLTQMIGSPVERGKTLFEIAPLDRYRVVLHTDERDLRFVAVGQQGKLSLAGMPADRVPFTVTRITAVAETKDGTNQFRVEGRLDHTLGQALRPGMEGIGKVDTGPHRLIWIWTHSLTDWLRLAAWKWLP